MCALLLPSYLEVRALLPPSYLEVRALLPPSHLEVRALLPRACREGTVAHAHGGRDARHPAAQADPSQFKSSKTLRSTQARLSQIKPETWLQPKILGEHKRGRWASRRRDQRFRCTRELKNHQEE